MQFVPSPASLRQLMTLAVQEDGGKSARLRRSVVGPIPGWPLAAPSSMTWLTKYEIAEPDAHNLHKRERLLTLPFT